MPNDQGRNILHFLALSGGTTLVTDLLNFFNQTYTSGLDTLKMVRYETYLILILIINY